MPRKRGATDCISYGLLRALRSCNPTCDRLCRSVAAFASLLHPLSERMWLTDRAYSRFRPVSHGFTLIPLPGMNGINSVTYQGRIQHVIYSRIQHIIYITNVSNQTPHVKIISAFLWKKCSFFQTECVIQRAASLSKIKHGRKRARQIVLRLLHRVIHRAAFCKI